MHNKSGINFIAIDFETAAAKHASICETDICVCETAFEGVRGYLYGLNYNYNKNISYVRFS